MNDNSMAVRCMLLPLFASGVYADRISETGETLKFIEKTVILDSSKIDTLLAIPL